MNKDLREAMDKQPEITLYRMVLASHICPYGLRAKSMLEEAGLQFQDRILTTREEVDAFETAQGVSTTPQIFVDGERIGGSEDLACFLETVAQG